MAKAYFTRGGSYTRYDTTADHVDGGYPKPVTNGWAKIDQTGFTGSWDSAIDLGTGKLYAFLGAQYIRIDHASNTVDGFERSISEAWGGFADAGFTDTIQAAVNWGNGLAYFFRGHQYIEYHIGNDQVVGGQALPIAGNWPGMAESGFGDNIDAAVMWDNGNAYFFKGGQYVRYEVGKGVAEGHPLPTADYWPGFSGAGLDGGIDAAWIKLSANGHADGGGGDTAIHGLQPGDHVWYWNGKISTAQDIPRLTWFPGADPAKPTDYQDNGKHIYNFVVHANGMLKRGQPHMKNFPGTFAWLDNNPGNITGVKNGTNWGQYPNKFNWHNFLVFPTPDAGRDAIRQLLQNGGYPAKTRGVRQWPAGRYRDLGITEAFHRWAPAEDGNDPDHYGAKAAAAAGVSQQTVISTLTDGQMSALQDAVTEMEGWVPGVELHRDDPNVPAEVRAALA